MYVFDITQYFFNCFVVVYLSMTNTALEKYQELISQSVIKITCSKETVEIHYQSLMMWCAAYFVDYQI